MDTARVGWRRVEWRGKASGGANDLRRRGRGRGGEGIRCIQEQGCGAGLSWPGSRSDPCKKTRIRPNLDLIIVFFCRYRGQYDWYIIGIDHGMVSYTGVVDPDPTLKKHQDPTGSGSATRFRRAEQAIPNDTYLCEYMYIQIKSCKMAITISCVQSTVREAAKKYFFKVARPLRPYILKLFFWIFSPLPSLWPGH